MFIAFALAAASTTSAQPARIIDVDGEKVSYAASRTVDGKTLTDWLGARTRSDPTDVDGRPPNARLRRPGSLCMSATGTLFVTPGSLRSGPVRRVDVKTRELSTWVY